MAASLTRAAPAQRLNLDGPRAPAAGQGKAVLDLAAELEAQAKRIDARSAPGALVRARLMGITARALKTGESQGQSGSGLVIAAISLSRRIESLAGAAEVWAGDPAALQLLARDLALAEAHPPTDEDGLLRQLQEHWAPMVRLAWDAAPAPTASNLLQLFPAADNGESPLNDPATHDGLAALDRRLAAADRWPSYAPQCAALRRAAAGAVGLATSPVAWISPSTRRVAWDTAAAALVNADEAARMQDLQRLAALAELAKAMENAGGAGAKTLHAEFNRLAGSPPKGTPQERRHQVDNLVRVAALIPRRTALTDDKKVVPQLRAAVRTVAELTAASERDMLEILPEALSEPNAFSSPRVVQAVAEHMRRMDDLELLHQASNAMEKSETGASPQARDDLRPLAERLLSLAKDALDLSRRDEVRTRDALAAALAAVRSLAADTRDVLAMPGESDLRAGDQSPRWAAILEDRAPRLVSLIDGRRREWVKGWANPAKPPPADHARSLKRIHALMSLIRDAADVGAPKPECSAGWELSADDIASLSEGLVDALRSAADQVLGDLPSADRAIEGILNRYAVVLAAARVRRALAADASPRCPDAAMHTLCMGPPTPEDPLAAVRADAAIVARYAFEAAAARRAGESSRAEAVLASVKPAAFRLRDALPD